MYQRWSNFVPLFEPLHAVNELKLDEFEMVGAFTVTATTSLELQTT